MSEAQILSDPGAAYDVERIRADFPILSEMMHGERLTFLDNGASAQKPRQVIEDRRPWIGEGQQLFEVTSCNPFDLDDLRFQIRTPVIWSLSFLTLFSIDGQRKRYPDLLLTTAF